MSERVLVVEDQDDIRLLIRVELEHAGYEVSEAADGLAGLVVARESPPDVVLLDVNMPGLDGYGVLKELKQDRDLAHIPVVFLTAQDSPEDIVAALEMGAHDHVAKPFHSSELIARVAAALRVKQMQDDLNRRNVELDTASRTDSLTGLPNRRHMDERLAAALAAATRGEGNVGVALVDVDRFKEVNDAFGHAVGDEVLQIVAQRLGGMLRAGDVAARWGGEEFLVLLASSDLRAVGRVAERLRVVIGDDAIRLRDGRELRVTVSVGCSAGGDDPDSLLRRADEALYRAKGAGRNAVAVVAMT